MSRHMRVEIYDDLGHATLDPVRHFVAEDATGWFGLLPGHQRFMTALTVGLARLQNEAGEWEYLAFPGALLDIENDVITVLTRRFWRHHQLDEINQMLNQALQQEAQNNAQLRRNLADIEENMLRRIQQLQKQQER